MPLDQELSPGDTDSPAGNEPSPGNYGSEQLRNAERQASGQSTSPYSSSTGGGRVSYGNHGTRSSTSPLSTSTSHQGDKVNYDSSKGVPPAEHSLYRSSQTSPGKLKYANFFLGTRRRRTIFGGGALGTIVGLVFFFTLSSGPLEFIHIAQLMEGFHFNTIQSEQDNRFMKEARLIRYASKGEIEKTRMGFIGNKFTDQFEAKLNVSGLSSAYTDNFGLHDGYVIDKNSEIFKGMDDDQIKAYVKANYGVEPVLGKDIYGSKGEIANDLVIDMSKVGFVKAHLMNYNVLRQAGYRKLPAAIGARMFCVRAGCNWHPLKKILSGKLRDFENWFKSNQEEEATGEENLGGTDDKGTQPDPKKEPDAANNKKGADAAQNEITAEGKEVKSGKLSLSDFKGSLSARLAGGLASAVGVLCIVKGVNDNAVQIKQAQVVLPLIRMGIEAMAVGSQIQSGQDVDPNELNQLSKQLNGVDSSGKTTSWDQSESIQANEGHSDTGVAPNGTLTSIDKAGPFDFIDGVPGLGTACGTIGSAILGVISFGLDATGIGAVAVNATVGFLTGVIGAPVLDQIAHWLAGEAVDTAAVGADYGNDIDYGSALAANSQAINAGGRQMSTAESNQLAALNNQQAQQQFDQHNLAYRLFDPYDEKSAISRVIDNTSPSFTQNIAKMGSAIVHFGSLFSSVPKLFSGQAQAATATGFDYGFPTYGFSVQDMDNPMVENPYQNACYVVGCPDKEITGFLTDSAGNTTPEGQAYIKRASQCFGVTIAPDSNGQWDVTSSSGDLPNPYGNGTYGGHHCDDESDSNWVRLRFFIMDTETMNSMGCYQGDVESCSDVGFSDNNATDNTALSGGPTGTGSGAVDEGTDAQLAQRLLDYQKTGQYHCDNAGDCTDLQKTVDGQSLAGSDGCQAQSLDPRVLELLLYLIENGGFKIGTFALCGDHSNDGSGGHSGGLAVDISTVNGASLAQNSPQAAAEGLKMDQFLNNNLPSELKLDQQISYGYGGQYYQPMAATQQYNGQLCGSQCVSIYTLTVEDEHTNHIHAGY